MKQPDLLEMLTYKRPAGTRTEEAFIARYIDRVPGIIADQFGNRILYRPASRVMIACHTDTVHRDEGKQRVSVVEGVAQLPARSKSNCLGADDTAGVYAALRMIEAGSPCSFVFHHDEEIGGRGSAWLAREYAAWLQESFDVCLSLDRRGTGDIITHQWAGRTASEAFSASLTAQLGMGHASAEGTFTDSANYAYLIAECSNLSVGYASEHTARETLDLAYLERLIKRLVKVDWTALDVKRDFTQEPEWLHAEDADDALNAWDKLEYIDEEGFVFTA